uniref:ORC1/DEAH AAA+ ATPase domain-containing protein n=1 Tax=Percolomonas cosmopolitus TaxID=63605 RepID=A0A7S1KRX5_9EUKA|mmetsp:Transcript_6586/g.24662  ORF Transcript_6586/g.24662 Transcript_6586/m.24662 type:complete len:466 (+) Transcript_6586:1379-2776(+)
MSRLLSLNTRRFFSKHQLFSDSPAIKKSFLISQTPILGKKLDKYFDENNFKLDKELGLYIPRQYLDTENLNVDKQELLQHAQKVFFGVLVHSMGRQKADRIMKPIRCALLLLLLLVSASFLAYYTANRTTVAELRRSWEVRKAKRLLMAQMKAMAPATPASSYIQRKIDEEALKEWVTQNAFSVVYGSKGIGKSTLMDEITRQLKQEGQPVLLIRITSKNPLKSLCDQLHIPVKQGEPAADNLRPPPSLELALDVLEQLTVMTKQQWNGERPIVIIDQINHLERIPGAIGILRGVGEEASNYEYLPRLVYVTSDHLLNNHFASLGRAAPYLVHEMSESEACKYLTGKFKMQSKDEQRDAYNRAGGVPMFLDWYRDKNNAPALIDGTIAGYLSKSGADAKHKASFVKLVQRLGKEGSVPADVALHLAGSEDFLTALQQHNILMKDQENIQFHDSAVRNYLVRKGYC